MAGENPYWARVAEERVLGALLQSSAALDLVRDITGDDFYTADNRELFNLIRTMHEPGRPVTRAMVEARAVELGLQESFCKEARLDALSLNAALDVELPQIQKAILAAAMRRSMRLALTAAVEHVERQDVDVRETLEEVRSTITPALAYRGAASTIDGIEISKRTWEAIEKRLERGAAEWPTGFAALDARLNGGARAFKQYIVAARPSVGKSAFAIQIYGAWAKRGYHPLMFQLEMEPEDVGQILIQQEGQVDVERLILGADNDDDAWRRLARAAEHTSTWSHHLAPPGASSLDAILSITRQHVARFGPCPVVIDYLQLIETTGPKRKSRSREEEVAIISRVLRQEIARGLGCSVWVLAQLNRDLEKRANPRPKLSDLRESGSLEQNADVVLMLHRPPRVEADALGCSEMELKNHPLAKCVDPREALICVPKQRRGWVGDIKADWFGEHQLFVFKDRKEDSDGGW